MLTLILPALLCLNPLDPCEFVITNSCLVADFNNNGIVDTDDLTDAISAWFSGNWRFTYELECFIRAYFLCENN